MAILNSRFAVSALFLMNGFLLGAWAPQIPEFAARLRLDEGQMGLMIAIFGLGCLISMPITGVAIAKFGHAPATRITSFIAATTFLWLALSPNIASAVLAVFIFGVFVAGMDVAMNAMAVKVERKLATPIMSSCHGFWSLGGLAGALCGGYLIQNFATIGQAIFTTAIAAVLVFAAWNQIIDEGTTSEAERPPIALPKTLLPYVIGIIALFSAMPEGAITDWSAFYLRNEMGSSIFISSLAYGAFSAAMAVVRFLGDPVRQRLGAVRTARICALVAAFGFLISGLASSPTLIIIGFAVTGLGLSNLIPIAFSAAGNLPEVAPGIALSLTTTIGYSGILVAPAIFGHLAEYTGFANLFAGLSIFLLAVFVLAPNTQYADFDGHR